MSLSRLVQFELEVQRACDALARKGMLVDVPYTEGLRDSMAVEVEQWQKVAALHGVENTNADRQIATALMDHGAELTEKTPTGQWKVDNKVLHKLADAEGSLGSLVEAILKASQLSKRRQAYVCATLDNMDANNRVHALFKSLAARTARMSISTPPLQQLPAGEALIRKCYRAPDGFVIISCDFDQVEFRIAGELAGEEKIIRAAVEGKSIHDVTALQLFGLGFSDPQYKLAKNVGFGFLFGGGAPTLSRQAEIPFVDAQGIIRRYREEFPSLAAYKREMTERVLREALTDRQYAYYKRKRREMYDADEGSDARRAARAVMDDICRGRSATAVTPSGRRLKVDAERPYSIVNYIVQSAARDVMAAALLRVMAVPVLASTVVMVVHDEVLAEVPVDQADAYCEAFAAIMTTSFGSVPITASAEVCGQAWGDRYGKKG